MASKDEFKSLLDAPIDLAPNTFLHFYGGGKLRAEFMEEPDPKDDYRSEEWMFSTNRAITPGRDNPPEKGLSRIQLPSGEMVLLKHLLETFPNETLGEHHANKFGPNLGVLLKSLMWVTTHTFLFTGTPLQSLPRNTSIHRSAKLRHGLSLGQDPERRLGLVVRNPFQVRSLGS
jgi:hypothetical protein